MSDTSIANLAADVGAVLAQVPPSGRFGTRKVFVSAIWDALVSRGYRASSLQGLQGFKAQLVAARRAGLLSLARADLVAAMPIETVTASEIALDGATYHFVVDERAREPWDRG